MKNTLLCILVLTASFIAGCKREEENINPFTNGTQFDYIQNNTIVVKNDSIIVSVFTVANNTPFENKKTIAYFGDSISVITMDRWYPPNNTHTITFETYYLNAAGLADSSIYTNSSGNKGSTTYYEYYPDGYLSASHMGINVNSQTYEYFDGNFFNPNEQLEYYPAIAKLDLISYETRKLNNGITGRDDKNLIKRAIGHNFEDLYYYQFDSNGYVTSMIIFDKSAGITSYLRYNFTYQFVQ